MNNIPLTSPAVPSASPSLLPSWGILLLAWVVSLLASLFLLVPNSDDIFYFGPGLGLLHKGALAIPMAETNVYIFSLFGTYSFLQGLFLFLTNLLGVPVNFFTYRLFQAFLVIGSLTLALQCLRLAHPDDTEGNANRRALFLGILAFTPFSMSLLPVRPEYLGFFFLFGSLLVHQRHLGRESPGWSHLALTGILFGLCAISHPVFALPAGVWSLIAAWQLWQRWPGSLLLPLFLLASALLPLLALLAFYWSHYPDSLAEFQTHGQELTSQNAQARVLLTGFINRVYRIFLMRPPWQARILDIFFYLPLFVLLPLAVAVGWRQDKQTSLASTPLAKTLRPFQWVIWLVIPLILVLMYDMRNFDGLIAFYAAWLLAHSNGDRWLLGLRTRITAGKRRVLFWILCLFIVIWPVTHALKFLLNPDSYMDPFRFRNLVASLPNEITHLLIENPEGAPLFLNELQQTIVMGKATPRKAYWIFPQLGSLTSQTTATWMRTFLTGIQADPTRGQVGWYVNQRHLRLDKATGKGCIRLPNAGFDPQLKKTGFEIAIQVVRTVQEDRKNIFLITSDFALGCP
ncbi:MAG: hypothetical protein HQL65_04375 [Magnetococcales bacterium]|nr:hypothetical protein [Magnetococcales bacterium]